MTRSRDTASIIPTVDAKGDLLVGTADNTIDNLSPGTNGQVLTANSATATGLEWATPASTNNFIINGAMDIWQRGTSTTTTALGYYTVDRFATIVSAGSGTWSRETSVLPVGAQYGLKFTASSANTFAKVYYTMETIDAIKLAGKTVTLSADFYESSGSGFNALVSAYYSTSEDNASSGTWTLIGTSSPANPSGVWSQTFGTFSIPSDAKSLQFRIENSSKMSSEHFIITNVQVEIGSVATPFKRNAPSIQAELAACQRYYYRIGQKQLFQMYGNGYAKSATAADMIFTFPVEMRTQPTCSANVTGLQFQPDGIAVTSVVADTNVISSQFGAVQVNAASGLTTFRAYILRAQNTLTPFIDFSAEL